jgi:DNA-binding NarL/FixJ family response regulator
MAETQPDNPSRIRVLCVDDHQLMRTGIIRIIELHSGVTVVAEASTGAEAVEQFQRHMPDVTLMDLQMPKMSGLEAIGKIRAISADARIVVLTMYERDENIYRALQAGASGYLLKDAVPEELIRVIRDVHQGKRSVPSVIQTKFAARSNQPALTAREVQVLELLVKGMRNKEIGDTLSISEETARVHLKSIFIKFNVHDRTAALAEALRRGIVSIPEDDGRSA